MSENTERIEGTPDGFEIVKIGVPQIGDWYLNGKNGVVQCKEPSKCEWLILRKIEKPVKYVPFDRETVPLGAVVVFPGGDRGIIIDANRERAMVGATPMTYSTLFGCTIDGKPAGRVCE